MLLDELAKELVEVTSSLVGGRTINVMNTEGVIIASTEHNRIGSFHQGAWEALRSGKVVNIRKDQVDKYPGAKEGCNMPLRVSGSIIGVVGIYGDPDQIQDIAQLLEVYAAKYYQLEAMMRPRLSEIALRSQLLMHLLSPSNAVMASAHGLMDSLNIHLQYPLFTAVLSSADGLGLPEKAEAACVALKELGFLNKRMDIWGIVDERLVLVLSDSTGRDLQTLTALPNQENGYRISFGEPSASLMEIQHAYEEASTLDLSCSDRICDIRETPFKCKFMLSRTAGDEGEFLEDLYEKLTEVFDTEECQVLLQSVACYYECSRSVAKAAELQFIHKNTLQYRVKRVLQVLEIGNLNPFWQEYLVRLLLEHLHRKSRG